MAYGDISMGYQTVRNNINAKVGDLVRVENAEVKGFDNPNAIMILNNNTAYVDGVAILAINGNHWYCDPNNRRFIKLGEGSTHINVGRTFLGE